MMERDTVWKAMATAYRGAEGDLPDRLMAALAAGQGEGGDIRGMQSAAIVVVAAEPTGTEWGDRLLDLRVEDHATPVDELARLVRLWRAYGHAERAEELELTHDLDGAMRERFTSPADPARPSRAGVLGGGGDGPAGRLDDARRTIAVAHAAGPGWAELLRRVVADGQVPLDEEGAGTPRRGARRNRCREHATAAQREPRRRRASRSEITTSRPRSSRTRGSGTSSGSDSRSGASPDHLGQLGLRERQLQHDRLALDPAVACGERREGPASRPARSRKTRSDVCSVISRARPPSARSMPSATPGCRWTASSSVARSSATRIVGSRVVAEADRGRPSTAESSPNASGLRRVASTISPPSPDETHTFTRPSAIT